MSKESETVIQAMKESLANARQFLDDSLTLAGMGSAGHAASLAVLGFEEAHKAYLLITLLPVFDDYIPSTYRKRLMTGLANHRL